MKTKISGKGKSLVIFLNDKDLEAIVKGGLRVASYDKGARLHFGMLNEKGSVKRSLSIPSYKDPDVSLGFTPKDLRVKISIGDAMTPIHEFINLTGALLPVKCPVESVKIVFPNSTTTSGYPPEDQIKRYLRAAA